MNYRFFIKLIFTLSIYLSFFIAVSQQSSSVGSIQTEYTEALKLYNNKAYTIAQKKFNNITKHASKGSNLKSNATFYEAMCAVKLNQPEADKMVLLFVEQNPNDLKNNTAFFNVGNYYFANKKAAHALKWFQKISPEELTNAQQKELNFKMGYSFLATKNLTLARAKFLPLINDAKYGDDSRYYYGFISYKLEDYGIAESTLKEIADNDSYKAEISYYLLDISFKAGNFKRCLKVGLALLPTVTKDLKSDVSKIIGESYFNLKEYEAAIPYLKNYKGLQGKWNHTDYYQLGYAYYKQNDFVNAVNNFNKIIDTKNAVAQNAYYHLGECYMKLSKKSEALNAFKSASEMEFHKTIQQDAALNYAKLSYEEGNPFKPVPEILQEYLKKYPESIEYKEINNLLITSFLNQNNFKEALDFLSEKKSLENLKLSKEISLYRGIQLFNENNYTEALPYFETSINSETLAIQLKAYYWEAETLYLIGNYKEALKKFISLSKLLAANNNTDFKLIDYNIGYSYFNLKNYKKAAIYFISFLTQKALDEDTKYDATVRLADSYFATTDYNKAINSYHKVTNNSGIAADYAQYQIGIIYGFLEKDVEKIEALKKVVNNYQVSNLKDDALYELGVTFTKIKNTKNADNTYNRLLDKYPNSIFTPKVLIRQGLLYFNENKNIESLQKYKEVAAKFPNTPEALEAVANARNVYIEEANLDAYVNWIETLKFINISNQELDNTTFAIAEKKYLNSKDGEDIIESLLNYIEKFREGIHIIKANYYAADVFFKVKEYKRAIPYYTFITEELTSMYTEDALNKLAQIYLQEEKFDKALPILDRLEAEAYVSENVLFAQSNLMKGYYETEAYDFAISYAEKILKKNKVAETVALDAKTIIARASIKTNDLTTAETFYTDIEKTANGALKAEALYYNAYFKNSRKEFEMSNKIVQKLIANYTSYKYWGVKSYVVMGKNYYGLKDIYQATFVLENVIENFTEFTDIIKEAQEELDLILENEAKTDNPVTPEKKN